jgi:hypothetical protein
MRVGSVLDSFDEIVIVINFRSDRFDNKTSSAQHILLLNGRGYKSLKLSANCNTHKYYNYTKEEEAFVTDKHTSLLGKCTYQQTKAF